MPGISSAPSLVSSRATIAERDARSDFWRLSCRSVAAAAVAVPSSRSHNPAIARVGAPEPPASLGGPSMIRAAAKNHDGVAVLVDPSQYSALIDELKSQNGATIHRIPTPNRR